MSFFKDLRVLIQAICNTLKTAVWALILLLASMYVFGIGLAQQAAEAILIIETTGIFQNEDYFDNLKLYWGSLGSSIMSLFMSIYGGMDWESAYRPLESVGVPAALIFLLFIVFELFCVLNVITGIFCQNAIDTYLQDTQNVIDAHLAEKQKMVDTLTEIFQGWDTQGIGLCSAAEFEARIQDKNLRNLLRSMDVDTRDAVALWKMFDVNGEGNINLDDFIHGCISLRGSAKAIHLERASLELFRITDDLAQILPSVENFSTIASSLERIEARLRAVKNGNVTVHGADPLEVPLSLSGRSRVPIGL